MRFYNTAFQQEPVSNMLLKIQVGSFILLPETEYRLGGVY